MTGTRPEARDRTVIGLLFALMFASGTETLMMTPLLPQMAKELDLSVEKAAAWVTAYVAMTGLFAIVFGPISDHLGRKRVLIAGTLLLGVGTLLVGLSSSFLGILACRALAGAGAGMLVPSTSSFVSDHFDHEQRAQAMGHVFNGSFLALILGVPIGAFFSAQLGWTVLFRGLGGLLFAMALVIYVWLPHPRSEQRSPTLSAKAGLLGYKSLLAERRIWGVLGMMGINGLSMTMYSVYLSPWMAEQFGFLTQHRGLLYAVGGPAVLLGAPLAGRLSNRFGRVAIAIAGSCLVGVMLLVVPFSRSLGGGLEGVVEHARVFGAVPWPVSVPLVVCSFLLLLGGATRSGPLLTYVLEQVPGERRGSTAAMANSIFQTGSALGASVGGVLWSLGGPRFFVICFSSAVLNFVAIAVLWQLTRERFLGATGPAEA